jgi:hypothetical protein
MRPLSRKAAKRNTRLLVLGHRDTDIHPTIRDMDDMRYLKMECERDQYGAPDTYRAHIYDSVPSDVDYEPTPEFETPVPPSTLEYDPDEETDWTWT